MEREEEKAKEKGSYLPFDPDAKVEAEYAQELRERYRTKPLSSGMKRENSWIDRTETSVDVSAVEGEAAPSSSKRKWQREVGSSTPHPFANINHTRLRLVVSFDA